MKQSLTLLVTAIVLAAISPVHAASDNDLSVKGVITPSACTPVLSADGVVDHGKISAQDRDKYGLSPLPDVTLQLAINCAAQTLIAIKSKDNRPGTNATYPPTHGDTTSFGLGLTSDGKKVGNYRLQMRNSTADGNSRGVIESTDGKTWFNAPDGTVWQPDWMRSLSVAAGSGAAPLPMQVFNADLVVSTWILGSYLLPITEDTPMDGSATLDVVYL